LYDEPLNVTKRFCNTSATWCMLSSLLLALLTMDAQNMQHRKPQSVRFALAPICTFRDDALDVCFAPRENPGHLYQIAFLVL
jgi:hypothetical protein